MLGKNDFRKAIFLVVYKKSSEIKYLLLKRKLHWKGWEFTKGGMEEKERMIDAVLRELKEETGLSPLKIKMYKKSGKYKYDSKTSIERGYMGQDFVLYSVEVAEGKVKIDLKEHSGFRWCFYDQALKLLTWKNQKDCLKLVHKNISKFS
jgi:8-oxo-dGTP pyrophosphatase MutT (NUDIX family)